MKELQYDLYTQHYVTVIILFMDQILTSREAVIHQQHVMLRVWSIGLTERSSALCSTALNLLLKKGVFE